MKIKFKIFFVLILLASFSVNAFANKKDKGNLVNPASTSIACPVTSVMPTSASISATGGAVLVEVVSDSCDIYTISTSAPWIEAYFGDAMQSKPENDRNTPNNVIPIDGEPGDPIISNVTIIVQANNTSSTRSGTVTIGTRTVSISQGKVSVLPSAAGSINGPATTKQGQLSAVYYVSPIPNATGYIWTVPTGVTIVSGSNTSSIQVNFSSTASSGVITVKGTNYLGNGAVSPNFNVTVLPTNTIYNVTGGGIACTGGAGVPVNLSGSQTSISYKLMRNTYTLVTTIAGTGSTINFGNQTVAGTYTVTAFDNTYNISTQMQGSAVVTTSTIPSPAGEITVVGEFKPGATGIVYSVPAISGATGYAWTLPTGGTIVSGANTRSITVNYSTSATSGTISVCGTNICGNGTSSSMPVQVADWIQKNNNLYFNLGNIGIGTSNPLYKLSVKGTIGCGELKVEIVSGWADYVFNSNYKLRSIKEVEDFINTNKHLPEIPSEKEVNENGISVGEMNAKLLMKIEELTLYLIDQQKQIDELKQQNRSMLKEIDTIKKL